MRRTRTLFIAALATASALALAACSTGSPSGGGASAGGDADAEGLTPVTVGLLTIAPAAAVQYGIDKGIFEEHGLEVKTQIAQGGAAMLPAVSTGQIDFGVGNPLSVLVASTRGVDVRITSGYSFSHAEGEDANAVVVKADSGIKSWKDLAGKTVSVNAINTQGDLTIMESVDKDGGDPKSVKFIEIAFPDALAQLDGGNADAVWIPEPFLAKAVSEPEKYSVLGYPNQNTIPGLPTMVTFASAKVAEDTATVEKWRGAITEVLDATTKDPEGFATTISEFTKMPPEVAQGLKLERLSGELDPELIVQLADLAEKYDFVSSAPDLDKVIVK